jgi:hypothetical protein
LTELVTVGEAWDLWDTVFRDMDLSLISDRPTLLKRVFYKEIGKDIENRQRRIPGMAVGDIVNELESVRIRIKDYPTIHGLADGLRH